MEPLPDLATLSDEDLKKLIDEYTTEEQEVSYRRRLLHGKIDILRAELVARLQKTGGRSVLDDVNVESLTEILTGKATPPYGMSHVYCPECGFQNPEAANYCAKCGALLVREEGDETTQTFSAEEADEALGTLDDLGVEGPALVVRSGGGPLGRELRPAGRAHDDRALAGLRRVPRRRHRLARAMPSSCSGHPAGTSRTREA